MVESTKISDLQKGLEIKEDEDADYFYNKEFVAKCKKSVTKPKL